MVMSAPTGIPGRVPWRRPARNRPMSRESCAQTGNQGTALHVAIVSARQAPHCSENRDPAGVVDHRAFDSAMNVHHCARFDDEIAGDCPVQVQRNAGCDGEPFVTIPRKQASCVSTNGPSMV